MLSKADIQKELGNGINLVPFRDENIKENSINLSASCYAWTMSNGNVLKEGNKWSLCSENNEKSVKLVRGRSAVYKDDGKKEILLLPFSTTLIETEEVLGVGNNIGGTYHSKVGLVSQGLGHIGTMLGPNFSGHSLIAIHNVSNEALSIEVGKTFVSVVFNYLTTPIRINNPTRNGHLEKLSELGVQLNTEEREVLDEDWKSNTIRVREKLKEDMSFNQYQEVLKRKRCENLKKYLNKKNIYIGLGIVLFIGIFYLLALFIDSKNNNSIWIDRFWNVGFSGVSVVIIASLIKLMKPSE